MHEDCYAAICREPRSPRFGTFRTIVLGRQESSIEKMAALMFPSTNLTTDGSRLFFW